MTPCIHRGEHWRDATNQLCGWRGLPEPIYRCRLHVICSWRKYRHGQPEKVCVACSDYNTESAQEANRAIEISPPATG